jgi:flagellar basal-body rod protein FlgF
MDRMIYLSMAGAKATMQRQDALAHNLANASTPGFRAEMTAFRAVPVLGDGASTRVYALETTPGYNAESGAVEPTGRNLDVALKGNAWLAVQGLDGTEAYTRAGSLDTDPEGLLITKTGLTVLGDGGPITIPANAQVQIAPDGTVSAAVGNAKPQTVGKLKLVTPEAPLQRGEDGLFRALEGSNVSAVETMIAMIAAARQFEQQMKMVHSAQEQEQAATKLLSNS